MEEKKRIFSFLIPYKCAIAINGKKYLSFSLSIYLSLLIVYFSLSFSFYSSLLHGYSYLYSCIAVYIINRWVDMIVESSRVAVYTRDEKYYKYIVVTL